MTSRCPYQIRQTGDSYHVIRPVANPRPGAERFFTVDGPFNTRYEAETAALRKWSGKKTQGVAA